MTEEQLKIATEHRDAIHEARWLLNFWQDIEPPHGIFPQFVPMKIWEDYKATVIAEIKITIKALEKSFEEL
ncbi:MAG: hypothetical protein ABH983_01975 [Candidatus Micrarchaeota archaeon]